MCRKYIDDLSKAKWTNFDELVQRVNEFHVIKIDPENWENSSCTCREASKNYKCHHIIILAAKLQMFSFEDAAMRKPLGRKPKRGPPSKKMSKNCLNRVTDTKENAPVEKQARKEPASKRSKI